MKSSGAVQGNTTNGKRPLTTEISRTARISVASVLSALAIAASYARPVALNVEPMTLIVFVSGIALGSRLGAVVGGVSMFVYSNFNPLGPAPPFIFLAQIGCMTIVGLVGGIFSRSHQEEKSSTVSSLKMGAAGAYLTIVFDLVTNLGFALSSAASYGEMSFALIYLTVLIAGLPFMVVHVISNTFFFSTAGPVASRYVLKMLRGEGI